jgi:hypothetical protein
MCFVFIWKQTATCATYSINWLVFITEMKCLQRGTDWVFKYSSLGFVFKRLIPSFSHHFLQNKTFPDINSPMSFVVQNTSNVSITTYFTSLGFTARQLVDTAVGHSQNWLQAPLILYNTKKYCANWSTAVKSRSKYDLVTTSWRPWTCCYF